MKKYEPHNIEIELDSNKIFGGSVLLDGKRINKITQIRFESGVDRVNTVTLTMIANAKIKANGVVKISDE
jgi:hypothetical protein